MAVMQFTPENRDDWRDWLRVNHADKPEVWVVFFKKTAPKTNLSYNDAVEEALCFGWVDGMKRSIDEHRYMHRFTPRKPDSKWSPSNKERVRRMVDAGLMMAAGEQAIARAKKSGAWDSAAGPPGPLPMPPEFEASLKRNKQARAFFESLAPSYRRQFIDWVASAKRDDTRQHRMKEAIDLLAQGKKLGMR
jgi:uncharacterized protein YdeI (YjbR/CyaY-like superfamily)